MPDPKVRRLTCVPSSRLGSIGLAYFTVRSNVRMAESCSSSEHDRNSLSNFPRFNLMALRPLSVDLSSFATVFRIRVAVVIVLFLAGVCVAFDWLNITIID